MPKVVLYVADGCHLCERAVEVVTTIHADTAFELVVIDITGDPGLEMAYREAIPVVEIDGVRAFNYVVPPAALRARLA